MDPQTTYLYGSADPDPLYLQLYFTCSPGRTWSESLSCSEGSSNSRPIPGELTDAGGGEEVSLGGLEEKKGTLVAPWPS